MLSVTQLTASKHWVDFGYCVMCVYVQPKWGYLPLLEDDLRGRVCRFCMHQFLKVNDGKWKSRSNFCPVDLFSGYVLRQFSVFSHSAMNS